MADKERISASVDPKVADYLRQNSVNASGLINELVKKHQSVGGSREAMLTLRLDQLNSETTDLQNRLETKRSETELVKSKLADLQENQIGAIDDAAEKLSEDDFQRDTLKVKYWSDETGLDKSELEEQVRERWGDTT